MKQIVLAALLVAACESKQAPTSAATPPRTPTPTGAPGATLPHPMPAGITQEALTAAAKGLTDDQLNRLLVYRHAVAEMAAPGFQAMGNAVQKAGGTDPKQVAQQLEKDPNANKLANAYDEALKKSGFTRDQVRILDRLTHEYYGKVYSHEAMADSEAQLKQRVAAAKAAGHDPSPVDAAMEKTYEKRDDDYAAFKKDFTAKYGDTTAGLLDKHWAEYKADMEAIMKGALARRPQPAAPLAPPAAAKP